MPVVTTMVLVVVVVEKLMLFMLHLELVMLEVSQLKAAPCALS